jgi:uncharacterized protein Yka (UPF0111/DUF47 family)
MRKSLIIEALGESALLLPSRLQAALAANDRLKLAFTLLQAAERHAEHPEEPPVDLAAELRAVELDGALESAVRESRRESGGWMYVPGAARLREIVLADLALMLAPLVLAAAPETRALLKRRRALTEALPPFDGDRVPPGLIGALTAIEPLRGEGQARAADSLHRLVMDLHKAVNALLCCLAEESIEGASVWQIREADRALVRAFMSGLNETAALKFDHPGLSTSATRAGGKLLIQNDLGTTDAHVLVVHVEGLTALLTYTDVHVRRLEFLQSLFKAFAVQWTEALRQHREPLAEDAAYYSTTGRFVAADGAALERYLRFLASRIVFLIDWNRARKQLRPFLPKGAPVRLLKWAADQNIGHRGFLQLGGQRLLHEALAFAQPTPLQYGERLHEILGEEATFEYLQFVLRQAAGGLLQGRAERFIRDEIKAELARRFRSANAGLLALALGHAERVFDLAAQLRESLLWHAEDQSADLARSAARARKWEQECDAIVIRVRSLAQRTAKPEAYAQLLHEADDAADGLEEAAFLLTHLAVLPAPGALVEPLQALAARVLEGAQESVKMYEAASHVTREGSREDVQDFFAAIDRIVALEHESDTAERAVTSALLATVMDSRALYLLSNLTRALERAADAFAVSALRLRDHVLNDVLTG